MIDNLEKLLARGQDNALLRFSLGQAYLQQNRFAIAIEHLRAALEHDPDYSAAWRSLAGAYRQDGQTEQAIATYRQGIAVAEKKGDKQAAKEMQVFLKRLLKK